MEEMDLTKITFLLGQSDEVFAKYLMDGGARDLAQAEAAYGTAPAGTVFNPPNPPARCS